MDKNEKKKTLARSMRLLFLIVKYLNSVAVLSPSSSGLFKLHFALDDGNEILKRIY